MRMGVSPTLSVPACSQVRFRLIWYKAGELKTLDVETGGDKMAREIGRYVLTIQQGSETTNIAGKYVVIWKQEHGEWKLDVDIWNS